MSFGCSVGYPGQGFGKKLILVLDKGMDQVVISCMSGVVSANSSASGKIVGFLANLFTAGFRSELHFEETP
jgi:hypothetical protein